MAATILAEAGISVQLHERRPSYGRKLLIAGSSGLNITHQAEIDEFISQYQGFDPGYWKRVFEAFSPSDWVKWINKLGLETFIGTSRRYFVKEMKASGLLKAWRIHLEKLGVEFIPNSEWQGEELLTGGKPVGLFLGGGSWEDHPPRWPQFMRDAGLQVSPFVPANVGFEIDWKPEFIVEAEGKPLKKIILRNQKGSKAGELVVTRYGLEGTPVYFLGEAGPACLDLKPDLSLEQIMSRMESVRENLSPMRRAGRTLALCEAALALLFHHTDSETKRSIPALAKTIKSFSLIMLGPRPLNEAISSTGGLDLSEVCSDPGREHQLVRFPNVFVGGEMLNWTAPTGGFLIQGSVSQGALAGRNLLARL